MKHKKGVVATGLTTVMLYFGFVLLIIIFYFIFKMTFGETEVKISGYTANADANYQLISILRSKVNVDGIEMNVAELISLYSYDSTKKAVMEKAILDMLDKSSAKPVCTLICIDKEQFRSSGCGAGTYYCRPNSAVIPSHDGELIGLSIEENSVPFNLVRVP